MKCSSTPAESLKSVPRSPLALLVKLKVKLKTDKIWICVCVEQIFSHGSSFNSLPGLVLLFTYCLLIHVHTCYLNRLLHNNKFWLPPEVSFMYLFYSSMPPVRLNLFMHLSLAFRPMWQTSRDTVGLRQIASQILFNTTSTVGMQIDTQTGVWTHTVICACCLLLHLWGWSVAAVLICAYFSSYLQQKLKRIFTTLNLSQGVNMSKISNFN